MNRPSEKALDRALEDALRTTPEFASWFLAQAGFSVCSAKCVWSRSDHPWTNYEIEFTDPQTGLTSRLKREGETDILVVYETTDGTRLGLHIENKPEQGRFQPHQPEGYAARARKWVGDPHYGNYQEWGTVLVAPRTIRERYPQEARVFGAFVAYEEIARHLSAHNYGSPTELETMLRCVAGQ